MSLLDSIRKVIANLNDKIKEELNERIEGVRERVDVISDALDNLVDSFTDGVERIESRILEKVIEYIDKLTASYESTVGTITGKLSDSLDNVSEKVRNLGEKIAEGFSNAIDRIRQTYEDTKEKITTLIETVSKGIGDTAKEIGEKIRELAERMYSGIKEAWDTSVEKVKAFLQAIWERILAALEKLLSLAFDLATWANTKAYPFITKLLSDTKDGITIRKDAVIKLWTSCQRGDAQGIAESLQTITAIREPTDLTSFLITLGLFSALIPQAAAVYVKPGLELVLQSVNANMPVELLPMSTMVTAAVRGIMPQNTYIQLAAKQGYSAEMAQIALETARPLPSPGVIQDAYIRGFISEAKHDELLRKHGFRDEDITLQKALYRVIPPLSDIIRMAVREAFTPEIAQAFGQYQDLPQAFVHWAEKQGLSREWAERYWAAHWDLPSATMGFEMFHRRIIDENELKLLLRALDIMPFWRDKLIQLSYVPYTRVDLRRMYSLGILSENDVYNAYLDLGYSPEKARNLTAFTVRYYAPEEATEVDKYRELTRSIYITAYKKAVITRDEALRYLLQIGYRENDAKLLLDIADAELLLQYAKEDTIPMRTETKNRVLDAFERGLYNADEVREMLSDLRYTDDEIAWMIALTEYRIANDLRTLIIESIHKRYVERTIDKTQASTELGRLFTHGREQETLFERWDIEREARTRKLTEAQLRAALTRGIINIDEYADELRGLGYAEKYVDILVQLARG